MKHEYLIIVDKFKSHQHSNGVTTIGKHARFYKKKPNQIYENDIVWQLKQQFSEKYKKNKLCGCISLSIDFYVKIPTTINKRNLKVAERRSLCNAYAPRKPDLTNIIKTIEDCIERSGIIEDDLFIVKYKQINKYYNNDIKTKNETALIKLEEIQ